MSLTAVYQSELVRIKTEVQKYALAKWQSLPSYRDADMDFFIENVLPMVRAGQEHAIALTDIYMSRQMGSSPVGLSADEIISHIRPGMLPPAVLGRSFETVWAAIEKLGFDQALAKGASRMVSQVGMDVSLAAREAALAYAKQDPNIAGFVRVAAAGCCDFCQSIDGAYVRSEDASPLHNNCHCTMSPVEKGSKESMREFTSLAPGSVFDDVEIHEHGELGPVITDKRNNFTSFDDLPKSYQREVEQQEQTAA
jgi:hypothetical protein